MFYRLVLNLTLFFSLVFAECTSAQSGVESIVQSKEVLTPSPSLDAVNVAARSALAPILTAWIESAHKAAIGYGVHEIPRSIREALTDHVPGETLDRVRWNIDDSVVSMQQLLFQIGHSPAVTLDSVIVFASAEDAANVTLWAHEIFHVMQYRDWGVDGFAARYLADYAAVEHDAAEFRWQWMRATGRVPTP